MKRTWMKTTLCLLSAVLLIAALSACSGGSRTEPNAKTEAHETEPQPEEQTEPEQLMTILDRDGDPLGGPDHQPPEGDRPRGALPESAGGLPPP